MTPKEKAKEIVQKFDNLDDMNNEYYYCHNSKQCALIAVNTVVDEIISFDYQMSESGLFNKDLKYWLDVNKEIINL